MKMNVLLILPLVSSLLAGVVTATYNLPQLNDSLSMANAFAQPSEVQENTSSSNGTFQISYTKLGVMNGAYQQILYDSGTNSLGITNTSAKSTTESESGKTQMSSSQGASQSQSNKGLSETDQANLRQAITNSGLFEAEDMYPPAPNGPQDYSLNVLSVTMDNRPRTVIWTSTSENVPATLTSIANTIEDLASR
jgi:phage tail sheath protein FI